MSSFPPSGKLLCGAVPRVELSGKSVMVEHGSGGASGGLPFCSAAT